MRLFFFLLSIFTLCLGSVQTYASGTSDWIASSDARADILDNQGHQIGQVYAKQGTQGVVLRLKFKNLPEGAHGMHFHSKGDCSDKVHFKKAGGHINPHKKPHGFFNPNGPHEGNLPNLIIAADGTAHLELYTQMVSISGEKNGLLDQDGSSLIIHTAPDDHFSQPIGGAGGRIGCGVFRK